MEMTFRPNRVFGYRISLGERFPDTIEDFELLDWIKQTAGSGFRITRRARWPHWNQKTKLGIPNTCFFIDFKSSTDAIAFRLRMSGE